MTEIYWLTRLGIIHGICTVVAIFMIIVIILILIFHIAGYGLDQGWSPSIKRVLRNCIITCFLSTLGAVFIPSKNDLLAIYGIGGTIDYIKSNDKAKELPDKVVDALTEYLDNLNKEE